MRQKITQNKKAVSEMIGYVLLIAGVIAMSIIVYIWLKSYVPRETPECPDGVSLFVQNNVCEATAGGFNLKLDIKNNGRFSIDGYYIRATTEEAQEVATTDISGKLISGGNSQAGIIFLPGGLLTGAVAQTEYSLDSIIYSVEIIPIRFETIGGKNRQIVCGSAKIKEEVDCAGALADVL